MDTFSSQSGSADSTAALSIGQYLIRRLLDYGVKHIFGVPGDYVLTFYSMLEQSPLEVVGCTREDCAGFAADAYARINGLGAVCVTYCVGGLSVCNAVAGAFAEKSPVVLISGSPGLSERTKDPLLHHKVRDFRTQIEVFEKLCVAGSELSDPMLAFREIDRVLDAAVRFKRPVYLELPRDMVKHVPPHVQPTRRPAAVSDAQALAESVEETCERLNRCSRPAILAGVEMHRFGLQDKLVTLAEQLHIPVAATMLGKSVFAETHPLYIGLYEGAIGHEAVTRFVEDSDCLLLLGAFMTDLNLGIYTANLDASRCVYATSEQLRIRHHHYHNVALADFIDALIQRSPSPPRRAIPPELRRQLQPFEMRANDPLTVERLIQRLNEALEDDTIIIADPGDALFASTELVVHGRTEFISPAYYTSMGFAVPAAVGAMCARPGQQVVVLVGDGAFQMTGMELSTIVRHGFAPIVIVLDNRGYGTERKLHPGEWKYNDIHPWHYAQLPAVLGGGTGYEVRTEKDFDTALRRAWADRKQMSLIHVHVAKTDFSQPLQRLAERLGARV